MRRVGLAAAFLMMGLGSGARAQQTQPPAGMAEMVNLDKLTVQGQALLDQARKDGKGSAGVPLAKFQHSFTMLTARTVDGGAELHRKYADFLFVLDGEGTELTGGTMVDAQESPNGELKGKKLEGAVEHSLHKGDMIHVPPGTNHQQLVAPGKFLVVYVIKVEETS